MKMEYSQRKYPRFSACGLNCGLCPRYHTSGTSKCPGCAGENFLTKHPPCGVLSCCQRHKLEYCFLCNEYPCQKYKGADASDSFITHLNQIKDFEKAQTMGLEFYEFELNEKVEILCDLLENYNDGRRKNFFCIAVNLLELHDIKDVMKQMIDEIQSTQSMKEKSIIAVRLFQKMADKRNITLKLRKK
jgi:hypothetical protein